MIKCLLNLFGTLLFTATLAVAAAPALAQDIVPIQVSETCQRKLPDDSWFLCGAMPFDGTIDYTNTGIHRVTLFTTGPDGVTCRQGQVATNDPEELEVVCGAVQVHAGLDVNDSAQIPADRDQLVYIARGDGETFSSRTMTVKFTGLNPLGVGTDASLFSDTRIFVEFNATTEDVGVRALLDGEPWNSGRIISPDQRLFQASGSGNLGQLGLTELAFEIHAPTLEELLTVFPEGEYEFRGTTVEGDKLVGTATLTHDIPNGPQILTPGEGALVDPDDAVISWDPVTEPADIEIAGYQVTVERGDRGRTLSLDVPAEITSVQVPPDFLEPGTDYLFKVLAIEVGGNQTITQGVFDTAEAD
jgi:Fibronectin type III domain